MSLSKHAALAEAKRRWGPRGAIQQKTAPAARNRCVVGVAAGNGTFMPIAEGRTFDEAFAFVDADPLAASFGAEVKHILAGKPRVTAPRHRKRLVAAAVAAASLAAGAAVVLKAVL